MEAHRDHDERVFGVRPDIILDMDAENADWIKHAQFDRAVESPE